MEKTTPSPEQLHQLLLATRKLLAWHTAIGVEFYPGEKLLNWPASGTRETAGASIPAYADSEIRGSGKQPAQRQTRAVPSDFKATPATTHSTQKKNSFSRTNEKDAGAYGGRAPAPSPDRPARAPRNRPQGDKRQSIIENRIETCQRCRLHLGRKKAIFGEGDHKAEIFFVLPPPGIMEEANGRNCQGEPGVLLDRMLKAMDKSRDSVYLSSLTKCPIAQGEKAQAGEIKQCLHHLEAELVKVSPKLICAMGEEASQALTGRKDNIDRLRGVFLRHKEAHLIATYAPADLLENPALKRPAWEDLQAIMKKLGQ